MSMFSAGGEIIFNHISEVVGKMDNRAVELIDLMAERIKRGGESRARRDTGEMADAFLILTTDHHQREVTNTSPHFVYNEFGTRKMAAQPMLTPAATDESQTMEKSAGQAFEEVLR